MKPKRNLLFPTLILAMFFLTLAPVTAKPQAKEAAVTLTAITRHDSAMYSAFEDAFKAANPELDVDITWLEITTNAGWAKAIRSDTYTIDFCWGGGPTVFSIIANEGLLRPLNDLDLINRIETEIPANIAGVPMNLKDTNDDYLWVASAISSFGYTVNHANMDKYGLSMPRTWQDLASPDWFLGRTQFAVAMGNAPETTSNTRVYQIITQAFGWEMGWQLMTMMGGNSKMTGESGPTRDSVITGPQAAAMTIDFYGYQAMSENPDAEYVLPEGQSIINGDPIALASTCDALDESQAFIDFVLSQEAQALWLDKRFNRLPIRADAFSYAASEGKPRADLEAAYNNALTNVGIPFNETEAVENYDAFTFYFEATINDAHNELVDTWSTLIDYLKQGTLSTAEFRSVVRAMATPSITAEECIDYQKGYLANPASIESVKASWLSQAKARYSAAKSQAAIEANDDNDVGEFFSPYTADITGVATDEVLTTDTTVNMTIVDYADYTYLYSTEEVEFYLDGVYTSTDNSTPFTIDIPTTTLADGPHSLMTIATEFMGTAKLNYVNFQANTQKTPPAYSITVPSGIVGNVSSLNGSISSDADFTPSFVQFHIFSVLDKLLWSSKVTTGLDSFSEALNTTLLPNGDHKVIAVVGYDSG
ncbi:MAG: extracellular solute-binding protein, partial [Candidatus Hodarchaeales archaeon]